MVASYRQKMFQTDNTTGHGKLKFNPLCGQHQGTETVFVKSLENYFWSRGPYHDNYSPKLNI
jgi:hypothetical protein